MIRQKPSGPSPKITGKRAELMEEKKKLKSTATEDAKSKPVQKRGQQNKQEGDGVMKKIRGMLKGKKSKNSRNRASPKDGEKEPVESDAPSKLPNKQMDVKPKQEQSKVTVDEKKEEKKEEKKDDKKDEKKEEKKEEKTAVKKEEKKEEKTAVKKDEKKEETTAVKKDEKEEEKEKKDEKKEEKKEEKVEEKKSEEEVKKTLIDLHEGDVLMGQKNIGWKIVRQLGRGGFGKVHEVFNDGIRGGTHLACKTEARNEAIRKKAKLRLKIEIDVILTIYKSKTNTRHFAELVDYGRDKERGLKFIVMTLLGPSLADLRKLCYGNSDYPKPTGVFVAQQTLEALQNLHEIGFIHCDIKPQNYAVGCGANETTIYLYDFGLSRRLYESDGTTLRKPREDGKVKFCGTPRYASIRCHERCEQSRRDDLESWLYMIYDIFDNDNGLRWKQFKADELQKYAEMKKKFLGSVECSSEEKMFYCSEMVPDGFEEFKQVVVHLKYDTRPPYEKFQETISKAAVLYKVATNKCEWIGKSFDLAKENKDDKQEYSIGVQQQGSVSL